MLFWLSSKPWAKNLVPKESMFWLFCHRLNSFLTSWPRVGYFALVLESSFSSWLFCLGPRAIFCLAIPYTSRYHETWNTPIMSFIQHVFELVFLCLACWTTMLLIFHVLQKKKIVLHVLLSHIDFERKASKERLSIPTSSIDFDFEQQK